MQNGLINFNYIVHGDRSLREASEKYHGPAFEIVLTFFERGLRLRDTRPIYFMRHLVTFLVFYVSVAAFYWLLRERFGSWKVGLFGAVALVLSPRIFAESFYNSKDLALLSFFIFSAATFLLFGRRTDTKRALLHALSCGFLVGIRIVGIIVPCVTLFLIGSRIVHAWRQRSSWRPQLGGLAVYFIFVVAFTILFWPILWENPLRHFASAFEEMRKYPWPGSVLYFGRFVPGTELLWHYVPVWIAMTTPVLYSVLFVLGTGGVLTTLVRRPLEVLQHHPLDLALLGSSAVPVAAVVVLKSVVYGGWRHLYFIYPALLYFSCHGLVMIWNWTWSLESWECPARWTTSAIVAASLIHTTVLMVHYHPYENIYFNTLSGGTLQQVKPEFDMDYWGLSCRRALEYLVAHEGASEIRVHSDRYPGELNALILPANDRRRICFVGLAEADYFLSHFRYHPAEFPVEDEVFSVKVDGVKICVLRRLHSQIASNRIESIRQPTDQ
ncbi:MAG TPA: hypothetical protein VGM05_32645 [Planctomycetaceae bacterium]